MNKIPTLFQRGEDRRFVTRDVTPGCDWVFSDLSAVPTRKYDGTCVMFDGAEWWARREVKPGKPAPDRFVNVQTDTITGKVMGWEPIGQSSFAKFHAEAVAEPESWDLGTYELIGPKINGNPERCDSHRLVCHAYAEVLDTVPADFDGLRAWLHSHPFEGIVWHHPDGRMAKIKARDFPREVAP